MDPKGYGRFSLTASQAKLLGLGDKRQGAAKAGRVALALDGRPPGPLMALHTCDNPPCVRPDHLYAGNNRQNMLERAERNPGSWPSGEANTSAVLTTDQVQEIRARGAAESYRSLGREYGVSHKTISKIVRGVGRVAG